MSDTVIAAIVTGCFTMLATLIAVYHEAIYTIFRGKYRHIGGTWVGTGKEYLISEKGLGNKIHEYKIKIDLRTRGHIVRGESNWQDELGDYHEHRIRGVVQNESLFTIIFSAKATDIEDFGVGYNFIHGNRKRMDLFAIANQIEGGGIVLIRCKLEKQA